MLGQGDNRVNLINAQSILVLVLIAIIVGVIVAAPA
jgi:hypothetical protein